MRKLRTVMMAGIGAGFYLACAPALAGEHPGTQAPAAGQSVDHVEAPDNPIHTRKTDDAAPPSAAPKTVVPGAKTETIYVSPEKARKLRESGQAEPVSEHSGVAAGGEHPGNSAEQ